MKLAYFIARRYFFSKKKKSFINIISIISMIVVAGGTMALIIILSVFNGLEGLLKSLYGQVDPAMIVIPAQGKSFEYTDEMRDRLSGISAIESITETLEDNVLLNYRGAQRIARVKGVSQQFVDQKRLNDYMVHGDIALLNSPTPYAIVGRGVQYDLGVNPRDDMHTIQMYFPNNIKPGNINPESMFTLKNILPGGVFAVEKSYDENLVFVPIKYAEGLFDKAGKRNQLELQIEANADASITKTLVMEALGEDFTVKTNEEIHQDLYRVFSYEKFFVFLTLSIVIAIAGINIFFSLSMLAIDKKKDVAILTSLGAPRSLIRSIFIIEGCIVAFTGAFIGIGFGLSIVYLQDTYGLVTMGMQTSIVDAYPVRIDWSDVLYTLVTVVIITTITSVQPAIKVANKPALESLQ